MLKTICYVSTIRINLSVGELETLFTKTKINNQKNNFTGILIYNNGNFLQILEGNESAIYNLFSKIKTDDRHRNVIKMIDTPIDDRIFSAYKTGFSVITSAEDNRQLQNYIHWLKNADLDAVEKLVKIIENFMD